MSAVMRPVVYQEPNPERARTYRSVDEAFREPPYAVAIQRWPAPRRRRIVVLTCWLLGIALLTAPWWLKP